MRLLFVGLLLLCSFSLSAREFKIEQDAVFKTLMSEFERPGSHLQLYQESEHYRFDLTLMDIIDTVSVVTNNVRFGKYQKELDNLIKDNQINFLSWFQHLKKLADEDEDLFNKLNSRLHIQLYARSGAALLAEYKYIDFQKLKDLGVLRRINIYNDFQADPEGQGLLSLFAQTEQAPFVTKELTVAKIKLISEKSLKKLKKNYYRAYIDLLQKQFNEEQSETNYYPLKFSYSKKRKVRVDTLSVEGRRFVELKYGVKVFKAINQSVNKQVLLSQINHDLKEQGKSIPKVSGMYMLTPIFIEQNWTVIKSSLQEFTLEQTADLKDDEYLYAIRTWVKKNTQIIQAKMDETNDDNSKLSFELNSKKRPRRVEILENYEKLVNLFPDRPWLDKNAPDLINNKGKALYFEKRSMGVKLKGLLKNITKIENLTGLVAGVSVLVLTGGNYAIALSTRSLVKKAVYTKKHDLEIEEFLKEAPAEVLTAFLFGAGFSAGRLYKIIALGAGQGALQSLITGQDIKTGAIVGAGMNLVSYYILPYSLGKPMSKGVDAKSLQTNRYLEILERSVKNSAQGTLVAVLTGEDPLKGAIVGAAYGAISAQLTIWFLGTRYFPFKEYTDAEIDDMIAAENNFQNEVGRGGDYHITRQLILDSNYRVGGILPKVISASITLPGNVSMSDPGFNRLTTLTHEAHHLMQQHQSGVFGFYLFRYIPTALRTGYDGHPDENFLKYVLGNY